MDTARWLHAALAERGLCWVEHEQPPPTRLDAVQFGRNLLLRGAPRLALREVNLQVRRVAHAACAVALLQRKPHTALCLAVLPRGQHQEPRCNRDNVAGHASILAPELRVRGVL